MHIGATRIGVPDPCFIVAEIGTSHNGDIHRAVQLIDEAKSAGADCVKSQYVIADEIVHARSGQIDLPGGQTSLYERFKQIEQPQDFYSRLKEYTEDAGLVFLCTPFGIRSARNLRSLGVSAIKIASPEVNHVPLLREIAEYRLPVVLSTGVSTLADIERALSVLGRQVVVLHCVTKYPAPAEQYNLKLIPNLSAVLGLPFGVSDHTLDPALVPSVAVALGACIIEKHFTLSRSDGGLDDPIALDPPGLRKMVTEVRQVEQVRSEHGTAEALAQLGERYGADQISSVSGTGVKELAPSEGPYYYTTNRSILFVKDLHQGDAINADSIAVLRSETNLAPGLPPEFADMVLGKRLKKAVRSGDGLGWGHLL